MKIKIGKKTFVVTKEQLAGLSPEALTAVMALEVTMESDGLTMRTAEEETAFIENHKKDARKEGVEIAVKNARKTLGLEFEGKTIDKLVSAVKTSTLEEAKIEPTEQLKKVNTKLADKEAALTAALAKVDEITNTFTEHKNKSKIANFISKNLPEKLNLPAEDMTLILQNKLNFGITEDGTIGVKDANGAFRKNATTADIEDAKDIVADFFKTNTHYVEGVKGGAGGASSGGAGGDKQTLDEFITEQSEAGIKPNSEEFEAKLADAMKNNLVDVD